MEEQIQNKASVPPQPKNIPRWRKILKRFFITISAFVLLLICSAFIIGYFYGDKIKQYAIDELNKNLNTQIFIKPENIDFTVLQNFPNASVDFKNVKALDATDKKIKDTLFSAGYVSFQFNIWNVFSGNYNIKKISVADVALNLKVDRNGKDNYHFLKDSANSDSSGNFSFQLQKIDLNNINVKYVNKKQKNDFSFDVNSASLKGDFSENKFSLETKARLFVNHLKSDSTNYLSEKNVSLAFDLEVDNEKNAFSFNEASIALADMGLDVSGNIFTSESNTALDIKIKGKDMDIESILSLLPSKYKDDIKEYSSEGDFYFTSSVKGNWNEKEMPTINADFGITNGEISQKNSSIKLTQIELKGNYSDTENKKSLLDVKNFSANLGDGSVSGQFKISDFENPHITAKADAKIGISELQDFFKIDTIESAKGKLKLNASFDGTVKSFSSYSSEDFRKANSSGEMKISDASMKLKNNALDFNSINGEFIFHDNDLGVNDFSGKISNSDFEMKGGFKNILAYFFSEKEELSVEASLHSSNIDLNELLSDNSGSKSDTTYNLHFSEFVNVKLKTDIGKLSFRKFEGKDIKGIIEMRNQKMILSPLTMKTMDGTITADGMVDASQSGKILITCDAEMKTLNVSKVFYEFENFGQDYLVDKQLKGVATANVQFASVWSSSLEINEDKVYTLADITIERGELIGFSPFIEIADDLKKDIVLNKLIEVDEFRKKMEHIKFSTLKNQVEIKKRKVIFLPMEIKSNAIDIDFSGWHKFNNEIEYHFSFLLAQVMTKGEKKRQEENKEFGVEEKDESGRILYYEMTGTVDNPIFKKDYKSKKEKKKEDIKKEKQTLKEILNEEFKWFKKDSTLNKDKKKRDDKKNDDKFIIKWDEDKKPEEEKADDDF